MIIERYFGGVLLSEVNDDPRVSHGIPRSLLPETAETSMENVRDCTMITNLPSASVRTVAVGKTKKKVETPKKMGSGQLSEVVKEISDTLKKAKEGKRPTEVKEGSVSLIDALKVVSCPLCSQWMMNPYRLIDMDTGIICCSNCALLVYGKELSSKNDCSSYLYYDANYFYPYRRLNELPKKEKAEKEKANESKS